MIERLVDAAEAELLRQDIGYFIPRDKGGDWVAIDGNVDLTPLVRAIVQAMREPTEGMGDAWARNSPGGSNAQRDWNAMIDAALAPPPQS